MTTLTQDQAREMLISGIRLIAAVGQVIQELGQVPSGILYANLAGRLTFEQYNIAIGKLKEAKLVQECNHVLTWVGPCLATPKVAASPR